MSKEIAVPTLTKARAMTICERIREAVGETSDLLIELHDGDGWCALGYTSWKECCEKEFQHSAWWANRQLRIAEIRKALPLPPKRKKLAVEISTGVKDSHLDELGKVPEGHRKAVLAWAEEKADGKPLTAKLIREAAKDCLKAAVEPPMPIPALLKAAEKADATPEQVEALSQFDEETQEALAESIAGGRQTVINAIEAGCAPDPTMKELIKQQASRIEKACRAIMAAVTEQVSTLADKWLDDLNRREGAMQKFKDACETLRSAKCVAACPKCEGQGCAKCHKTGMVPRYTLQQLT